MLCAINVAGKRYKELDLNPLCGDNCDNCGECLFCYDDVPCATADGVHMWVEEFDTEAEAAEFITERS